ncbi:MAG: ABC transporter ATP-binding protein [Chloroflexi bacterium]|nr:ABC transporter ATP-binding protein [Chloroflexota bacterium]
MNREVQQGSLLTIWKVVRKLDRFVLPHWRPIILALLLMMARSGVDLLRPWPLKFAFDAILGKGPFQAVDMVLLASISGLFVAVALFHGGMGYLQAVLLNKAGRIIVYNLRSALLDHIQRLSLRFHLNKASGDLLTRFTTDTKAFREVFTDSLAEVVSSVAFLIGMSAVLLWLDWKLAMVVIGTSPVLYLFLVRYTSQIKEFSRLERKREGALASVVHEALATVRLTRVLSQEERVKNRFQEESAASLESGLAAAVREERFAWVVDILGSVVTAVVLGLGVMRVVSGEITPGELIVFVSYVRDFYKPMRTAIKHTNKITRAAAQVERVVEVLDIREEVTDLPGARRAHKVGAHIEFRGVGFEYEAGQPVLKGVSIALPSRQVTAIVGPTGTGKTTLVSLIPRLYDPTEGAVLIDGQDIRSFTLRSLRRQISMVLQESVLLRASIAENIAYGRSSATFEEVQQAAQAANAHDFIMALPQGYDTEVGERGETLSGGQRQLIAIARAMLQNTPIVILDEPLTGVDAALAVAVLEALERLMEDKTGIIITHDLSLVQRADSVVVLESGSVVQHATPKELLDVDGAYRRMFQAKYRDVLQLRE